MNNFQLDQQTMDEMTRRLPDQLKEDFDDLKLVSMDILCEVKEGERLKQMTIFFNTNMLKVHN